MPASCQTIAQTIADVVARRPVLRPVLQTFAPLLEARAALPATLAPLLEAGGFRLPEWNAERAGQGAPLLAGTSLAGTADALKAAADVLLPLLAALPGMAGHVDGLASCLAKDAADAAEALLAGDASSIAARAEGAGVPAAVLAFALEAALGPVLRAAANITGVTPWDSHPAAWTQGICPVCGTFPSIAYLEGRTFDEKNAFLAGGGGKKHLHCALCGTEWHFRRGACPACGRDDNGVMELLQEAKGRQGERVDWCTACKSYCPTVDLRERDTAPDMDTLAIGMMHLDMVASGRGLHPLKPSFWNQF